MRGGIILIMLILLHAISAVGQNMHISPDNYYEYCDSLRAKNLKAPITEAWLDTDEIVPVIIEELERYGFEWVFPYRLYKLQDGQFIVVHAYCEKDNFGFVCSNWHGTIEPQDRDTRVYSISYNLFDGSCSGQGDVELPDNIHLINRTCYWYKYLADRNETNDYVDRATIMEILRTDIRKVLSQYKDLNTPAGR